MDYVNYSKQELDNLHMRDFRKWLSVMKRKDNMFIKPLTTNLKNTEAKALAQMMNAVTYERMDRSLVKSLVNTALFNNHYLTMSVEKAKRDIVRGLINDRVDVKEIELIKKNLHEFENYILKLSDELNKSDVEIPRIINMWGNQVFDEAERLVPVATGRLSMSEKLLVWNTGFTVGFYSDYAMYVHENMNNSHPTGCAKFLEIAVQNVFPVDKIEVYLDKNEVSFTYERDI